LLDSGNWQADWITPDWDEDTSRPQPAPLLRHSFSADSGIVAARVYATSLGLYELRLNGQRVGDAVLTPGWTSYDHRLQYQTYDVTDLVHEGDNALGAILGDGWYRGYMGFTGERNMYGDRLALLLQLHLTYADGRGEIIGSDGQWRATRGPIQMSDIYNGEIYDARQEKLGWDTAGYDDNDWCGVRQLDHTKEIVVAQDGPFIRRHEELRPARIFHSPKGETILDFGQNMVGWIQLRVRGPVGTTITLRHAEVLDQQGNLYTENLRRADQTTRYTLKGLTDADEVFEPHFTFQGFQYVAVEGFPGEPTLDNFTGVVIHSDTPSTGTFECSNPLINQLQHNIVWGQKGNFVDVPTDCPQRDERLGWTGDTQVFIRTACFNMNVPTFFTKWLRDLSADQRNGSVPHVVPDLIAKTGLGELGDEAGSGAAAWGDAAVICPWTIYLCYGDTRLLAEQYESMTAWVNYIHSRTDGDYIWRKDFQFGDWLDYRGQDDRLPTPVTNYELIGTAFFAYSADLLAKAARVLGKTAEAERYDDLANKVKAAFNDEFVTPAGRVGPNTQTAYLLALHFDLLPEAMRPLAVERLVAEIEQEQYHLTTGFVGTPYLCHVLSRYGHTDVAYKLLNQEDYPSWLYPVKQGATTIWERWDGIKPDGSFQDAGMNSFNHYAYGAIGEWLYRVVAGIELDPAQPGYKHIILRPQPGGGLTQAAGRLKTLYGELVSQWAIEDDTFEWTVVVPPNTTATVHLPPEKGGTITRNGQAVSGLVHEVGAGEYRFVVS
jgi:alpha-L-rhamnosidase